MKNASISLKNKNQRVIFAAKSSLIINFAYGIGNAAIGFMSFSWWFITVSVYYMVLSVMRFCLVISYKNDNVNYNNENFIKKFSGIMFFFLSIVLSGTVLIAVRNDIGTKHNEIVMITIATYTFTKLMLAIVNLCKSKKFKSPIVKILRNISVADAAVSIFSLQRSMLVSFEGTSIENIRLFNVLTGFGMCITVLLLGINLFGKEKKMAKSKLVEINEDISKNVKMGYEKVRDVTIGGYELIEKTVVGNYKKIEDAFVEKYLIHDGETIEEAKKRIKDGMK